MSEDRGHAYTNVSAGRQTIACLDSEREYSCPILLRGERVALGTREKGQWGMTTWDGPDV